MDSLTHILIGISVGRLCPQHAISARAAALIGALATSSPDADVLFRWPGHGLPLEEFHRGFTHSLVWIPFGALLLASLFWLVLPKLRHAFGALFAICFLGLLTHAPLDACTSYGTELFWPFYHERISWDLISIVDPVFSGIIILGLIASRWTQKKTSIMMALILAFIYLIGFCTYQHHRALMLQQKLMEQRAETFPSKSRVIPDFGTQYTWHSLYAAPEDGHAAHKKLVLDTLKTPLFQPAWVKSDAHFAVSLFEEQDLPQDMRNNPLTHEHFLIFQRFAQGYLTMTHGNPLTLADCRYLHKQQPTGPAAALWGITFIRENDAFHVQRKTVVSLEKSVK